MPSGESNRRYVVTGGSGFIGTSVVEQLAAARANVLNYDIAPPLNPEHTPYWHEGDILDTRRLTSAFAGFGPTHVIHLAARTDCDENTTVAEGYQANTLGTANVLAATEAAPGVDRVLITSSQYVCRPGHCPMHDRDYSPHTVYGHSKVETEQVARRSNLSATWTIIRPVNIWGPWHMRYRGEIWRIIKKGIYVHPGRQPVMRTYGYVGNVVWQMLRILESPPGLVHGKVFYCGDLPIDVYEWVNAFSKRIRGRRARVVPRQAVHMLAIAGDVLQRIGLTFPITSSRYRNMIQDYLTPVQATYDALGQPPFSLEAGVEKTVAWLET